MEFSLECTGDGLQPDYPQITTLGLVECELSTVRTISVKNRFRCNTRQSYSNNTIEQQEPRSKFKDLQTIGGRNQVHMS